MPWVEQLPNGRWRACWRDRIGRRRSTTGPVRGGWREKSAALRAAGQKEVAARRGDDDGTGRAPTWGNWCPKWLELRRVEPQTARQDRVRIGRYLEPRWGKVRLNRINRADLQAWVNELTVTNSVRGQPLSAASVDRIYRLLSASLRAAVNADIIAVSPCSGIKLPIPAPAIERFLTRAERDAIVHHMHDPDSRADAALYRALVIIGTESGLRFGELAGLHWWRVDLEQGLIHVAETWDPVAKRIKGYPKSRKARAVPISDRCLEALSVLLARRRDAKTCGLTHSAGRCRSPLVLLTDRGVPLDVRNFGRRQWADACARAGVEHATPHSMRHTYASWLVQAGVPLQQVSELLGHSTVLVTQRYGHLATSQHAKVLDVLNREG